MPVVATEYQKSPSAAWSRATTRGQRGSCWAAVAVPFDFSVPSVLIADPFQIASSATKMVRRDTADTPALAFKSK